MTYAGGPAFQWNILNYGQITNNVRLQDARLEQLLVDYQNTVLNAQQQVDNGLSTFLQSRQQVGFLRGSAEAAKGALRVATQQYNQGATDFTTVLVTEQNLLQAESNLAVAMGNVPLGLPRCVARSAADGRYGRTATSSMPQRATRCVRAPTGGTCCRPLANRNRRLPVCPVLTILGRLSDRRDGEVAARNLRARSRRHRNATCRATKRIWRRTCAL